MAKAFTRRRFARSVLKQLGIKPTDSAMQTMLGWMAAEGGHWHNTAKYNPLNTTQNMPGSGDTGSQGNISVYRSPRQGVRATVKTLENGNYGGILHALKTPGVGDDIAAIDRSPWGTHGSLVGSAIRSAPSHAGGPGGGILGRYKGGGGTTTITETVPDVAANDAVRRQAALEYLSNSDRPDALLNLAVSLTGARQTTTSTRKVIRRGAGGGGAGGGKSSSSAGVGGYSGALPKHRQPSALYELFYQGAGGINVKLGKREPMGFVDGHTDHVHVAANPKAIVKIGRLAQSMGLHVGENPRFGGVSPVHAPGSYHYKKEAVDVSGDPAKMRKFAHRVAKLYGVN